MAKLEKVGVPSLAIGLKTKSRPSMIPPGAAQDGSKNFWLYPNVLRSAPGYSRLTTSIDNDYTYKLDGVRQYWHGKVDGANSAVAANTASFSIQVIFRIDKLPRQNFDIGTSADEQYCGTLLYRGSGMTYGNTVALGNTAYWLYVAPDTTTNTMAPRINFLASDGAGFMNWVHSKSLTLGTFYCATMTYDAGLASPNQWRLYVGECGGTQTVDDPGSTTAGIADISGADVFLGASPVTSPGRIEKFTQYHFCGVIQEFRVWDRAISATEVLNYSDNQFYTSDAGSITDVVAYYKLTGTATNKYFAVSDSSFTTGTAPKLALYPRDATWLVSGHTLGNPLTGTASISLDGEYGGLTLPEPYLYRQLQTDDDGRYPWSSYFSVSMRVKPRILRNRATLFHYVHCPTNNGYTYHDIQQIAASGTITSPKSATDTTYPATGNLLLDTVDVGAGVYQFRGIVVRAPVAVTGESVALTGVGPTPNNINTTLANVGIERRSLNLTVTHGGGTGVMTDDGAGALTFSSGTSAAITTATIDYDTGALVVDLGSGITVATATYNKFNATTVVSAVVGGIAAGTAYTVTLATDFADSTAVGKLRLYVDDLTTVSQNVTAGETPPKTPNDPRGTAVKYWAEIGRCILRTQQSLALANSPSDVIVEYDKTRFFDGEIKQLVIGKAQEPYDPRQIHSVIKNQVLSREDITTYGVPFTSAYSMEEGAGDTIEDIGALGNSLYFREDSDHTWGKSGISTSKDQSEGVTRPFLGVFDHRYRSATGEVRKVIAVAGGSVYEVNPTTGALTWFADGFRNDDGKIISSMRYQDSTLLAATGTNKVFQLWKDQLYKLSIDAPKGIIPYGLTNQTSKEAGLRKGVRRYAFTYYSAHQNKRGSVLLGPEITINHRRADVMFGTDAEINQTYPTFGASLKKAPYDISKTDTKIQFSGWVGRNTTLSAGDPDWYETNPGTSGANTNAAPLLRVNLQKSPFINDKDQMTIRELANIVDDRTNRVFVEDVGDDSCEFRGAFPGSRGFLWLQDDGSAVATVRDTSPSVIRFSGVSTSGTSAQGTGVTGHGLALPSSDDNQVTHLEIWRTLAGGNEYFLVARIPNGTKTYLDNTDDADLVGQTLNINQGAVPLCNRMIDFQGRALYFGNTLAPFRLYMSEPGEPWNVPPQNTIDLLDGTTLEITGAARTENTLVVFKNDTTFVITATGNPVFPFNIDVRHRSVGCVSPFGIVNVFEVFHYPDEQGFFQYDTNSLKKISDEIDPTWESISAAHYDQIVGVSDRPNDAIIWFAPTGDTTINGTVVNDAALVYFYHLDAWSYLEGCPTAFATIIPDANEINRVWTIDPLGYIHIWDSGTNYGAGTKTSRTPATAAGTFTTTKVTVAQATLANLPDGYRGLPITVVDATDGTRATRICTADTLASPSVLTLSSALPFTPAQADTVLIGSIETDWISGEVSAAGQDTCVQFVEAHLQTTAQSTSAEFEFLWLAKYGIPTAAAIEQSASNPTPSNQRNDHLVALRVGNYGRRFRFRFRSLGPDKPFEIRSILFKVNPATGPGEYGADG